MGLSSGEGSLGQSPESSQSLFPTPSFTWTITLLLSPEKPGPPTSLRPPTSHDAVSVPGYGFVDFDSPTSAQKAVTALKASGVQAQMAKVG